MICLLHGYILEKMKILIVTILISVFAFSGFAQSLKSSSLALSDQIADDNSLSELRIYPNPCKDSKITVEFTSKLITEILLINIAGKEVLQKSFAYPENKKQIGLEELPNGIYMVRIKTDDHKLITKKLMISKN